jgi:multisubunit Na+/H+ antiporter MnhB subunit
VIDKRDVLLITCSLLIIVGFILILVHSSLIVIPPPIKHRWLSWEFLTSTYNWENKTVWSASPEVVTSILWDYRGLDTVYETSVFFFAIIGGLMLVRDFKGLKKYSLNGMSLIAKTVTKIILVAVPIVAASVALHGHLTPGGGFQGGSIFAVASLLAIVALGGGFLFKRGWSKGRLLGFRTLGLVIIASVALTLPFAGLLYGVKTFIIQNQYKNWAPASFGYLFSLPGYGDVLYSGSLIFLNIAEFLAVSAGLILAFLILSIPLEDFMKSGGVGE